MRTQYEVVPAGPGWYALVSAPGIPTVYFPVVAWAHDKPYSEQLLGMFVAEGGFVGLVWAYEDFRKQLDPSAPTGFVVERYVQERDR